jgi:anti-sigma factor RsiW
MRTPLRGLGPPSDSFGDKECGLTMDDDDRYAMWDAAYVLGSLSAGDRREFETHMSTCPQCRQDVAELSGVPALLSQLDLSDMASIGESGGTAGMPQDTPALSPDLLPTLLATVRWRRRRTRVTTWVASAAAAAVLVIGVFIGVQDSSSTAPQQVTASAEPMAQVGTNMLKCVCLAPLYAHHDELAMVVVGRDGSQTRLATWTAEPGHTATPAGSISTPMNQIAAVQIVAADSGQVLLQRSL